MRARLASRPNLLVASSVFASLITAPTFAQSASKAALTTQNAQTIVTCAVGTIECIHPSAVQGLINSIIASACMTGSAADCFLPSGVVSANLGFTPRYALNVTDYCSPTQISNDATSCANNAIAAAGTIGGNVSYGGADVVFPSKYAPYTLVSGPLVITSSYVHLVGDSKQGSYIQCANAAFDCVQIGKPTVAQIRDVQIKDIGIWGNGAKTAGAGIHIQNAYRTLIERVDLENMIRGVENDATSANTNTVTLRDVDIAINQTASDYGIYWHAPGNNTHRSDIFNLDHVSIVGQYLSPNSECIHWDGLANTLNASQVSCGQTKYGLRVVNTAGSTSYVPAFLNAEKLEFEGFTKRALSFEAGLDFKISTSDFYNFYGQPGQGNSDDYAVAVLPDTSGSVTRDVQIANSRIGGSANSGLYDGGHGTQLTGVTFVATSMSGANSHPVIDVLSTSEGAVYNGVTCEEYGGPGNASYCVQTETGATNVNVSGFNPSRVGMTPWYNDLANALTWTAPRGGFGTFNSSVDGALAGLREDRNGSATFLIRNSGATGSVASLELSTRSSNSYAYDQLLDNGGLPYRRMAFGSGVKALVVDLPPQSTAYAYSTPLTGTTVTIGDQQDDAPLEPAGTLAALTVNLPTCSLLYDGKVSNISTTQTITSLTIGSTSGAVMNAPTTLAAGAGARWKCVGSTAKWYRQQ